MIFPSFAHQQQHTRIEERRAAARVLESELEAIFCKEGCGNYGEAHAPPPVAVDRMNNQCSLAFGALPERLAVLDRGRLVFLGGKGPEEYSVDACRRVLQKLVG